MVGSRVVFLGDSLGMPRPMDMLNYEDTYPYVISKAYPDEEIIPRFSRARDSQFQASEQQLNDDIIWLNPDILCIHLGIVDCAPRLFSRLQQYAVGRLPSLIQKPIVKFLSKHRYFFTKNFHKVYVTKEKYEANMRKIITTGRKRNARIVIVSIMMPPESLISRSYGFRDNVIQYNAILKSLSIEYGCFYIDLNELLESALHLCDDGIHLNKKGNTVLADQLVGSCVK